MASINNIKKSLELLVVGQSYSAPINFPGVTIKTTETEDKEFEYLLYNNDMFWGTYQKSEVDMLIDDMSVIAIQGEL